MYNSETCVVRHNHQKIAIALAGLLPFAAHASQPCELVREYQYRELLLLTSVNAEQATLISGTYTATLAELSINWSISDVPTSAGQYPFFVQYSSASVRKLRSLLTTLEVPVGNLRGEGTPNRASFNSNYQLNSFHQGQIQALFGQLLDSNALSINYSADSIAVSGPTNYHDLISSYECLVTP